MINRAALILKYKTPAIKWVNEANPYDGETDSTAEEVNEDKTVYLISDEDSETSDAIEAWLKLNYKALFESELESWYTDESLWPKKRTFALFKKWFGYECHTVIEDTVDGPIFDDEDEADDTYH